MPTYTYTNTKIKLFFHEKSKFSDHASLSFGYFWVFIFWEKKKIEEKTLVRKEHQNDIYFSIEMTIFWNSVLNGAKYFY
jgi:hypothetical protein